MQPDAGVLLHAKAAASSAAAIIGAGVLLAAALAADADLPRAVAASMLALAAPLVLLYVPRSWRWLSVPLLALAFPVAPIVHPMAAAAWAVLVLLALDVATRHSLRAGWTVALAAAGAGFAGLALPDLMLPRFGDAQTPVFALALLVLVLAPVAAIAYSKTRMEESR